MMTSMQSDTVRGCFGCLLSWMIEQEYLVGAIRNAEYYTSLKGMLEREDWEAASKLAGEKPFKASHTSYLDKEGWSAVTHYIRYRMLLRESVVSDHTLQQRAVCRETAWLYYTRAAAVGGVRVGLPKL